MVELHTGRLLVASHELHDVHFRRAVVLVLAHDAEEGAAGVILNRPSPAPVPDRLTRWRELLAPPAEVFVGGPVERATIIGVAALRQARDDRGSQVIAEGIGVIDLTTDADALRPHVRGLRLFSGYAGWSGGQVEREIADGAWFVVDARPGDAMTGDPDGLWRAVLARQGGLFTTVPDDPRLN